MSETADSSSNVGQLPSEGACPQPDRPTDAAQNTRPVGADDGSALQAAVEDALAEGKAFAVSEGNYKERLAALAPRLLLVRQEIHQREKGYRKGRRNGAPNWGRWLKSWRAEAGVKISDKTIKKVLDEIDETKPAPRPKKPRTKPITPAEARKMTVALLAMHEALGNVDEHGSVLLKPEDIAPILELAPSADQLNRLLERLRFDADGEQGTATMPTKGAPTAAPGPAEGAAMPSPDPSTKQSPQSAVKIDQAAELVAAMVKECAPSFEGSPSDLPPGKCTEIIYRIAKDVSKQFRGPGVGGFSIKVSHHPPKRMVSAAPKPGQDNRQPSLFEMSAPNSQATLEKIAS